MDLGGHTLILGSKSPRRRELLAGMMVDFTVDSDTTFVESVPDGTPHEDVPALMSEGKSRCFHRPLREGELLLTSDTMVLCGKDILGKPHGREDAARMLRLLSGRKHSVISSVTLRSPSRMKTLSDCAEVLFRELTEEEIYYYIDKCSPFDKAGAYGIQEWIGYVGIPRIEGSFFTIMGLPVHLVYELLSEFVNQQESH